MVLNTSRLWCKDYDGGANDCKYLSFIGMTAAEGTLCVLWVRLFFIYKISNHSSQVTQSKHQISVF